MIKLRFKSIRIHNLRDIIVVHVVIILVRDVCLSLIYPLQCKVIRCLFYPSEIPAFYFLKTKKKLVSEIDRSTMQRIKFLQIKHFYQKIFVCDIILNIPSVFLSHTLKMMQQISRLAKRLFQNN